MADVPPPQVNPDFLAAQQKMADAQAASALELKRMTELVAGDDPVISNETLFRGFFNLAISNRMGNTTTQLAAFADECLQEYRTRYPLPPPITTP